MQVANEMHEKFESTLARHQRLRRARNGRELPLYRGDETIAEGWIKNTIPGSLIRDGCAGNADEVPSGGGFVPGALIIRPAGDRRERRSRPEQFRHTFRGICIQASLGDLGNDGVPSCTPGIGSARSGKDDGNRHSDTT
ncbi:hypothetical protein NKH59_22240 [Mesorhizobium sp. M0998]